MYVTQAALVMDAMVGAITPATGWWCRSCSSESSGRALWTGRHSMVQCRRALCQHFSSIATLCSKQLALLRIVWHCILSSTLCLGPLLLSRCLKEAWKRKQLQVAINNSNGKRKSTTTACTLLHYLRVTHSSRHYPHGGSRASGSQLCSFGGTAWRHRWWACIQQAGGRVAVHTTRGFTDCQRWPWQHQCSTRMCIIVQAGKHAGM